MKKLMCLLLLTGCASVQESKDNPSLYSYQNTFYNGCMQAHLRFDEGGAGIHQWCISEIIKMEQNNQTQRLKQRAREILHPKGY